MLRDATIQTTQHSLTSERVSKEVRYLSDTLEFSANAASLFLSPPVNKEFISWEDHYQFNSLESLLTVNRIQKRSAYSRKPTGVKQHTCHFESPPASQELALPPIASIRNASVKSPGIRKVKSRRSNFSVHSIPMDPSVDWANTISSAVDNFEVRSYYYTYYINHPLCTSSSLLQPLKLLTSIAMMIQAPSTATIMMILAYRNFAV